MSTSVSKQGLLRVAIENARAQEKQDQLERTELKMELVRERELRETLEKQLSVEQKNRGRGTHPQKGAFQSVSIPPVPFEKGGFLTPFLFHAHIFTFKASFSFSPDPEAPEERKEKQEEITGGSGGGGEAPRPGGTHTRARRQHTLRWAQETRLQTRRFITVLMNQPIPNRPPGGSSRPHGGRDPGRGRERGRRGAGSRPGAPGLLSAYVPENLRAVLSRSSFMGTRFKRLRSQRSGPPSDPQADSLAQSLNETSAEQEEQRPLINACRNCPRDEFVWA